MSSHDGEFSPQMNLRMLVAIFVVAITFIVEVIGGNLSNSLALLSDAGHVLTDLVSLVVSWVAYRYASKKSDVHKSYGYHRCQVMAAFVNGLSLCVIGVLIIFESVKRFVRPLEIHWKLMFIVAVAGFITNIVVFAIMYRRGEKNLNIRSAVLHIIGDLLGSIVAIISSVVIMLKGWLVVDPILSVFVSIVMLSSGYYMLRSSGNILLEGKPGNIDIEELEREILRSFPNIMDVHHIHIWSLTPDYPIITMHIRVVDGEVESTASEQLLRKVKKLLNDKFSIPHATIELECGECSDNFANF